MPNGLARKLPSDFLDLVLGNTYKTLVISGPNAGGKTVLLLDGVLDTGRTLARARDELLRLGADRVVTVVLLDKPAREVMTEKVVTCVVTDRAAGIMAVMVAKHLRHVPVIDEGGRLISMLSIRDLLQLRLLEVQSEADAMRSYIAGDS